MDELSAVGVDLSGSFDGPATADSGLLQDDSVMKNFKANSGRNVNAKLGFIATADDKPPPAAAAAAGEADSGAVLWESGGDGGADDGGAATASMTA